MRSKTYKGSCLCGKVTFTARTDADETYFCHCTMCRKNYGLYGAFLAVPTDALKIRKGSPVRWYRSSKDVTRGFCRVCGSPVVWRKKESTHVFILPGLVDGKIGKKKAKHIFVTDRGDYYDLPRKKHA